jgi:hypothetical protein
MIKCQQEQIKIQDTLLKEMGNLSKQKDVFTDLQAAEILLLRNSQTLISVQRPSISPHISRKVSI